ncbi:hypothetical protein PROFUN_04066 [Planoprotostelium fungivorum]|uniref:Uncharacterized protein n=1 Tax=Planoprotostelium fungivorum TaxID=1890364 RepID=A0A2P6NJD9_9EUKA|nr:hypothetical protein PROFUN_04066 [Planoprotostelium fungivorum]
MPKVKTSRTKYPEGWDDIEPTLTEFTQKMKDAENEPHEGKRKAESVWPILRLHHQRTRYVYEAFYKKQMISRELYDFCLSEGYADSSLIAKWKKAGYEKLCCIRCMQLKDHNFGSTCICRVPKKDLEKGKIIECTHCGCKGCASWFGFGAVATKKTSNNYF